MNWLHTLRTLVNPTQPGEEGSSRAGEGTQGRVTSVNTYQETLHIDTPFGGRPITTTHPFVSSRSWLRTSPEEGTAVAVMRRRDSGESGITNYVNEGPAQRIERYFEGNGVYRPLAPGELEGSSYGLAQWWLSRQGVLDMRGGMVRLWLDHPKLEAGSRAPLHRRELHEYTADSPLQHGERFGQVVRKGANHTRPLRVKVNGQFATEYTRTFSRRGQGLLVAYREGDVVDEAGSTVSSPAGKPLRIHGRWFDTAQSPFELKVDEDSNVWVRLTQQAKVGFSLSAPAGGIKLQAGDHITVSATNDISFDSRGFNVLARGVVFLKATSGVVIQTEGALTLKGGSVIINGRVVQASAAPI